MQAPPIENAQIKTILENCSPAVTERLMQLRALIYRVASNIEAVTSLEETLKWNQPSYVSPVGSTIRIDGIKDRPDEYALYFICSTNLIATFRTMFSNLTYEGERAILFNVEDEIPSEIVMECIARGLTYHLDKNRRQ